MRATQVTPLECRRMYKKYLHSISPPGRLQLGGPHFAGHDSGGFERSRLHGGNHTISYLLTDDDNRATIRWKLLTGASALALTASIASAGTALADDSSQLWIDFGGQLERVDGTQQPFAPAFTQSFAADGITPVEASQKPPLYSSGFEGAILFQPEDSKWHFSAAMRYGRSNNSNTTHEQTSNPPSGFYIREHSRAQLL